MWNRYLLSLLIASSLSVNCPSIAQQHDSIGALSSTSQTYFDSVLKELNGAWSKRTEGTKWNISLTSTIAIKVDNTGSPTYSVYYTSRNPSFDRLTLQYCKKVPLGKPPATWNPDQTIIITYNYKVNLDKDKSNDRDFSAVGQLHKGMDEYGKKNLEQAAFYFKQAVDKDPFLVVARANLSGVYCSLGKIDEGIAQLKECLRLDPDDDELRFGLAKAYMMQNKVSEAKEALALVGPTSKYYEEAQKLLASAPASQAQSQSQNTVESAPTIYNRGVKESMNNNWQGAIENYKKAIQMAPDYFLAHSALGNAYVHLNRTTEAMAQFRECLRLKPDDDNSKYLLGVLLHANGNIAEGLSMIKSIRAGTDAYTNAQGYLASAKNIPSKTSSSSTQAEPVNQIKVTSVDGSSENSPIKDKWALVIGISKFANPQYNLKYSAKDAQDFYNYLITEGNFKKDHVLLLLNENATRRNIMSAFGDKFLPSVSREGDLVAIYISTHGTPANKDPGKRNFLIAYDTESDALYETGVDMDEISKRVKEGVRTERVLLVMDTCYSGAGVPGARGVDDGANFDAKQMDLGNGHLVVTSSSPSERSWESKVTPNGVFTKYLIQNLRLTKGNVKNSYDKLKDDVGWEVQNAFNQPQHPQMGGEWKGKELILNAFPTAPRQVLNPDLLKMMSLQNSAKKPGATK